MRHALVLLALVTGCSCGATTAGTGAETPSTPFVDWSVPGLSLVQRCYAVPDRSTCVVVGTAADGTELEGRALWARIAQDESLGPADLARRAIAVLLGETGSEPLLPDGDRSRWGVFVSEPEWAAVQPPSRDGEWLVFDFVEGEMSPEANRIRVHVPTGAVERASLAAIASLGAAPIGEPFCAPVRRCGCDDGCARFEPVPPERGSDRFRSIGDAPALFLRTAEGWMVPRADETCDRRCPSPRTGPDYRCTLGAGECARAPAEPAP